MTHAVTHHHDHHHDADSADIFGFWIYILSDCILFASIFATFAVLRTGMHGAQEIRELVDLPYILIETMTLLTSSFTYGLAILAVYRKDLKVVIGWLALTFLCGAVFIGMEINEFVNLYIEGNTWATNGTLSGFFTLVGTHGLHVSIGLLWMAVLIAQLFRFGITPVMEKRLTYLGLFWAFLDIIWIFVFTIVYLMGVI